MIARACLTALLLAGTVAGAQQPSVVVRDAGPGPVGRYLQDLLRKPGTRVIVAGRVSITADSVYPADVVVIGARVDVSGTVNGDVVVVGGDLFIKPRARVEGQGVAIGGGAYPSLLGSVRDGLANYRDFTYDAERIGGTIELRYREQYVGASRSILELPALYGLRLPTYDRTNGLSLAAGPAVNVGRANVDVVGTYRSQLGTIDPSVEAELPLGRTLWLEGFAGRETRSNEDWINGVFSNSLNALLNGQDERNWYRATGGWATVNRMFETPTMTSTWSLGGAFERASAVRPGPAATSGPWSLMERTDVEDGMFRPNPQIGGGDITSVIGRAAHRWTVRTVKARLDADVEMPVSVSTGESFTQLTIDGRIDFPTFGLQRYRLEVHGVGTFGDSPPGQRFAYIGGSSTLPTQDTLLTVGGDQLLFVESRYEVPIPSVRLPLAGFPTLTFRHIVGAAEQLNLPDIIQIVGVRLSIPYVRAQWLMDTGTGKTKFSAGISFSR